MKPGGTTHSKADAETGASAGASDPTVASKAAIKQIKKVAKAEKPVAPALTAAQKDALAK